MQELELGDPRGAGDGFVGAEIPYVGGAFSMLLIVPDEGRFAEVRDRLSQGLLAEIDTTFTTGPLRAAHARLGGPGPARSDGLAQGDRGGAGPLPGHHPRRLPGRGSARRRHRRGRVGTVAAAATGFGFAESGRPSRS